MSADISTREGLFAVMRQIAAEREAAKPLVAELLAREEIPWDEDIPQEWRTAGFVQELTKAAGELLEREPQRCLDLLRFVIAFCPALDGYPSLVPAHLTNVAWRDVGYAERYSDAAPTSLSAFNAADRAIRDEPSLVHDSAIIASLRGGTFTFMRNLDEAERLLARAEKLFEEFGDSKRVSRCRITRAVAAYYRGDFDGACRQLTEVIDAVANENDLHTLGVVHNNIGQISAKRGDLAAAERALTTARGIYVTLGMQLEIDRADWGLAAVFLARGDATPALETLLRVRKSFLEHELIENAGLVGLDAVDALLVLGREAEARELVRQVADEFRYADVGVGALQAVTYLRDFLTEGQRARGIVRRVKTFVQEARFHRAELFVPPADDEEN